MCPSDFEAIGPLFQASPFLFLVWFYFDGEAALGSLVLLRQLLQRSCRYAWEKERDRGVRLLPSTSDV